MKVILQIFILGFLALSTIECTPSKFVKQEVESISNIKNDTIPLIVISNNGFDSLWQVVEDYDYKLLPKSALSLVDLIYSKAQIENNYAQIIKSTIYKTKYISILEEDGLIKAIELTKKEVDKSTFPTKQILSSVLAEMYTKYLNENSWKIRGRTTIDSELSEDINSWSYDDFLQSSQRLYLYSVKDIRLANIDVKVFDEVTLYGEYEIRPNLYDFLANRVIDYFSNPSHFVTQPVYDFVIKDKEAFADADVFSTFNYSSNDSISNKQQVLLLFQKLIQIHLQSNNQKALLELELDRLSFVVENSILKDKGALYLDALQRLEENYKDLDISSMVSYNIANYYRLGKFDSNPNLVKAHSICEKTLLKYPKSYGALNCKKLIEQIESKDISINLESFNPSNKPMLALVDYRNMETVFCKVIKITPNIEKRMDYGGRLNLSKLLFNLKSELAWEIKLPKYNDFESHSTEVMINGLPYGKYIILISDSPFYSDSLNANYYITTITDLAYISLTQGGENNKYIIIDRLTGLPKPNVRVSFYQKIYNKFLKKYIERNVKTTFTNNKGFFTAKLKKKMRGTMRFKDGKDKYSNLDFNDYSYKIEVNNDIDTIHNMHLFLDRAIYRPGQTVYFKGIISTKTGKNDKVVANEWVELSVVDRNYTDIIEMELTSNEFGSFSGKFIIPFNCTRGQMTIDAYSDYSEAELIFQVEEYKRPKFEVSFDDIYTSYRLGDKVELSGFTKAFSGNSIDGAKVKYWVTRTTKYINGSSWNVELIQGKAKEIVQNEMQTDKNGMFKIEFEATSGIVKSQTSDPSFIFNIFASVTDLTGETHTSRTSITVGKIALKVDILTHHKIHADSLDKIKISTLNLNGQFEKAIGVFEIVRLTTPNKTFVNRIWRNPDTLSITGNDYKKFFPLIANNNENNPYLWKKGEIVFDVNFNSDHSLDIPIDIKLEDGKYIFRIKTKDKYDNPIIVERIITIFNYGELPSNEQIYAWAPKRVFKPGDTLDIFIKSYFDRNILVSIERNGTINKHKWIKSNAISKFSYLIKEEDRGGFYFYLNSVLNNRQDLNTELYIDVPFESKKLDIEYISFRNKLKPGEDESWSFKIKNASNEKVMSEMVATLYDSSLDYFKPHLWEMNLYPRGLNPMSFSTNSFVVGQSTRLCRFSKNTTFKLRQFRKLNWFGVYFNQNYYQSYFNNLHSKSLQNNLSVLPGVSKGLNLAEVVVVAYRKPLIETDNASSGSVVVSKSIDGIRVSGDMIDMKEMIGLQAHKKMPPIKIRKNLDETVFFMPNLKTDNDGNIIIDFKMNEALTKWKFMALAHTKDLEIGLTTNTVVTQKELMIVSNPPRFFREGDTIEFSAKVNNLTIKSLNGLAKLELFDALTMQPIDSLLGNFEPEINFTSQQGQSIPLSWVLNIPIGKVMAVTYRVTAKAGLYSDGEENTLQVVSNRILVTETLPLSVKGNTQKTFHFKRLNLNKSKTLEHHKFTLEFTSNPVWYAIQSLPYMMNYQYDCSEQVFNKYYANKLGVSLMNNYPKIKSVFNKWKNKEALLSNLSKNQELKSALLAETPWVLDAQNENTKKKNIGLLFDINRMDAEFISYLDKLSNRQAYDGAFSWFPNGEKSWYITQYIVEGFGHLKKLGIQLDGYKEKRIINRAMKYIDGQVVSLYKALLKGEKDGSVVMSNYHLNYTLIHYLYTRSFFLDIKMNKDTKKAFDYYLGQAEVYWTSQSIYMQGMIALSLHRSKNSSVVNDIVSSIKERALHNEDLGMYWKTNNGFNWYQLPIETHALMIELFNEVTDDYAAVEEMKIWLLKNKQTNKWSTTKSTSAAVYVLLTVGDEWLKDDKPIQIHSKSELFNEKIKEAQLNAEAGTGYIKMAFNSEGISDSLGVLTINNPNNTVSWGASYWQYFEDLDKVLAFEETPLKLKKKIFKVIVTKKGKRLIEINAKTKLMPGDLLTVRIVLNVDRDMDFVHMKDMRASGCEPLNVISRNKYQDGLSYYESTGDLATDFFFSNLHKGSYVFEYPIRVVHKGDFSTGITTIQSMYAPEFLSHSEGGRLRIK